MQKFFVRLVTCVTASAICTMVCMGVLLGCSMFEPEPSDDILPHLISAEEAEANPIRPIDQRALAPLDTTGNARTQLREMYLIVTVDGAKPDVDAPGVAPVVRQVYNAATDILDRYILNDFSPEERVHVIHDYLAFYITYDFALADKYIAGEDFDTNDPAFDLDGVLINRRAVCDGLSRAFALMCHIEGIPAERIEGLFVGNNGQPQPHAWNKVRLGSLWYNVDVTMDNAYPVIDGRQYKILHHGYFLVSDDAISERYSGRHIEDTPEFNPISETDFVMDGVVQRVTSASQLNQIFTNIYFGKRRTGKIELALDFGDYDWRDPTSYLDEIAKAYSLVKDKDVVFDRAKNRLPFFRYPNGVFVFVVYK